MPWKSTKLVFCGLPVRRRTLYGITLAFGIATVPTWSWALLILLNREAPSRSRLTYVAAAGLVSLFALYGLRCILRRNAILYWEEARSIWPRALLGLVVATGIAMGVATTFASRGHLGLIMPGVLAAPWLFFILWRWMKIGDAPKRHEHSHESSHGPGSRHGSTPPFPPAHDESPPDEEANED